MTGIFRVVVLVSTGLYSVGYWLPYVDVGQFSPKWDALLYHDGSGALITFPIWAEFVIYAVTVSVSALLYFFIPFGRRAFVLLVLANLAAACFLGARVTTPVDEVIWNVVTMSDGALLAMLYLTPLARRFEPDAAQPSVAADGDRAARDHRG